MQQSYGGQVPVDNVSRLGGLESTAAVDPAVRLLADHYAAAVRRTAGTPQRWRI